MLDDITSSGTKTQEDDNAEKTESFFDPFQIFEVNAQKCHIVQVHILEGRDVSKGWVSSLFHTFDLYVVAQIQGTANGFKKTKTVHNICPVWNEKLNFLIDTKDENILDIFLMDANSVRRDTRVGADSIPLNDLKVNEEIEKELVFEKGSTVKIKILLVEDNSKPDLRFSLALSQEEKDFLTKRRLRVFENMKTFLGSEYGPRELSEVPCVGILGSGGGFRAMVGLSGAMKALHSSGVLGCTTYIGTLSGGSWYIAHLYSQHDNPTEGPEVYQDVLKQNVCQNNWLRLLTPFGVLGYISAILGKSRNGQPVSLTDFFGHLVGDTVLGKERMYCKLSDQAEKLKDGQMPLPLYTCINVKKNVSARVYQDWMEFSPFEIGLAKYGTFMKPSHFGSKFFMGKLVKQFEESPMHYLLGLWGSAYCILFKRLMRERWKRDFPEMMIGSIEDEPDEELDTTSNNESTSEDEQFDGMSKSSHEEVTDRSFSELYKKDSGETPFARLLVQQQKSIRASLSISEGTCTSDNSLKPFEVMENPNITMKTTNAGTNETIPEEKILFPCGNTEAVCTGEEGKATVHKCGTFTSIETFRHLQAGSVEYTQRTFWQRKLANMFDSKIMNNRAGRAGLIFNPLRGLNISQTFPFSPFSAQTTPDDDVDFKGIFEPQEPQAKRLFLVDSGLTFNLPFPLLLRPQRAVDIYLTYDFSTRSADNVTPFREVLHVEKWAQLNRVPFPPIEEQVKVFLKEPLRECYVFENINDPYCPVIIHFIILNDKFRAFSAPGVRRKTEEERQFADFDIFSDPKDPFSLYNFSYNQLQFDRLTALMEFNTLQSLPVIREQMARVIARKRYLPPKPPIKLSKIKNIPLKTGSKSVEKLHEYINAIPTLDTVKRPSIKNAILDDETQLYEVYYDQIQEHYKKNQNVEADVSDVDHDKSFFKISDTMHSNQEGPTDC